LDPLTKPPPPSNNPGHAFGLKNFSPAPVESNTMSTETTDRQQVKVKEFMQLLPLTLAVAGLPDAGEGKYFNEGQMENRAATLKLAYKVARGIILDIAK